MLDSAALSRTTSCASAIQQDQIVHFRQARFRFPSGILPRGAGSTCQAKSFRGEALPSFQIWEAKSSGSLRAAAGLRAAAFYVYPQQRSELAKKAHQRMKADTEWKALEEKLAGEHAGWQAISAIVCCIASIEARLEHDLVKAVKSAMDLSCQIPAEDDAAIPKLAIGTLDYNIGSKLPSEELCGRLPSSPSASGTRAYLSNVCVMPAARRLGVAAAMIKWACEHAHAKGVEDMYVHVVADNIPAVQLYCNTCRFNIEAEESVAQARLLERPRRLLLHRQLG